MEVTVDIKFDDLLKIVKNLPASKLFILKEEIEKKEKADPNRAAFKSLLLNGPTFSDEQLNEIAKTRIAINQWRTK